MAESNSNRAEERKTNNDVDGTDHAGDVSPTDEVDNMDNTNTAEEVGTTDNTGATDEVKAADEAGATDEVKAADEAGATDEVKAAKDKKKPAAKKAAKRKAAKRKKSARRKSTTQESTSDNKRIVPFDKVKGTDLESIAAASRQIATMKEPSTHTQEYLEDNRIIYPEMQSRQVANAFREIRTKLLRQAQGQNFVTMVTSVSARGGGSFIALNLAAAFAFDDSKTALLVDCNLRDPDQHNLTGVEPEYGLTDFLEDPGIDTEKIIYPSGIHRLRVIPVGRRRENVVEHFTSVRMRTLIEGLQERYPDRYIILDAPPIGESVDARILADLCDLAVIVIDYGKVTESQVKAAVDAIGKERLGGVILNRDPGYSLPMSFEQILPRLTN